MQTFDQTEVGEVPVYVYTYTYTLAGNNGSNMCIVLLLDSHVYLIIKCLIIVVE